MASRKLKIITTAMAIIITLCMLPAHIADATVYNAAPNSHGLMLDFNSMPAGQEIKVAFPGGGNPVVTYEAAMPLEEEKSLIQY